MSFHDKTKAVLRPLFALLAITAAAGMVPPAYAGTVVVKNAAGFGVIKGMVRDDGGSPIADATVAIFQLGTSKVLKQVRSATDGSFIARIIPGTYTVLAVAEGFNPITLSAVEVNQSAQLVYGFKLQRSGSGNTLPEKRLDRNNPKWIIRSAQTSRSIYQNQQGNTPINESTAAVDETAAEGEKAEHKRGSQTVAETYFTGTGDGGFAGLNFATLMPVSENAEIVLAGQVATGKKGSQRFEAQAKFRPTDLHQIRVKSSYGNIGRINVGKDEKSLGQFSFQALDEWKVREGIVFVFGVDYSKFVGAGDDYSISPRLGLQFDLNAKTRVRSAFTTQTEDRTWSKAIELEDTQVIFRDPAAIEDYVVESGKPLMNKSRRLEFGVERVLDNKSSVEANVFFDTTTGRGVGLAGLPFDSPTGAVTESVGDQQGKAQGLRLVYNRRLNSLLSTAAGYSLGTGQKLSTKGITNPAELFQKDFFQTFFGQVEADVLDGTSVKTIFRFSPKATVFAIDPFQGRLAIYDPSLSILVTQDLPTLGLPFRAQAVVDARNLFDFQTGSAGEEGSLRLNSQRRALRGGILVRF